MDVLYFQFFLYFFAVSRFVQCQVGTTVCTDGGTECDALANTACDVTGGTLVCECNAGFIALGDNSACTFDCGTAPLLTDGSAATTSLTSITYTCDNGFDIDGTATITCVDGTGWEAVTATCQCPALTAPTNGGVDKSSGTTAVGGTATYTCDATYTLSDTATRTCVSGTGWDGSAPTCSASANDCGSLSSPANGQVIFPTTTEGAMATYSCNSGFTLVGGSTRTCEASGWSGSEPTCQQDCGSLSNPANGQVSFPTTADGSMSTYSCNSGFTLVGGSTRTCEASGWSGSEPTCQQDSNADALVFSTWLAVASTILVVAMF